MKIIIDTKQLLKCLRFAADIDRRSGTALTAVKLKVTKTKATLHIANREQSILLPLCCTIEQAGQTMLPWTDLLSVLRHTKDKMVSVDTLEAGQIAVLGQTLFYKVRNAANPDNNPDVVSFKHKSYVGFTAEDFRKGLNRTLFAADKGAAHRPGLDTIYFDFSNAGQVGMVATDGIGFAWQRLNASYIGNIFDQVAVPAKALTLFNKILADVGGSSLVKMFVEPPKGKFTAVVWLCVNETTMVIRLPEGGLKYPNWQDIVEVPATSPIMLLDLQGVVLDSLIPAAKSNSDSKGLLNFDKSLTINAVSGGYQGVVTVPITSPKKYKDKMTVSLRYLVDALNVLQSASRIECTVRDSAEKKSCCRYLSVRFDTEDNFTYLIYAKEVTE